MKIRKMMKIKQFVIIFGIKVFKYLRIGKMNNIKIQRKMKKVITELKL